MPLLKRTYALPSAVLQQFEQEVEPGQRSTVVGELMREWLEQQRREQLRQDIIEGCRDMEDIYLEVEREYHPLEEEWHRAIEE